MDLYTLIKMMQTLKVMWQSLPPTSRAQAAVTVAVRFFIS